MQIKQDGESFIKIYRNNTGELMDLNLEKEFPKEKYISKIKCVNDKDSNSINPLYYLARMSKETHFVRTDRWTRDKYSCYDGFGSNGRVWGAADTNKKTKSDPNNINFLDVGRYSE